MSWTAHEPARIRARRIPPVLKDEGLKVAITAGYRVRFTDDEADDIIAHDLFITTDDHGYYVTDVIRRVTGHRFDIQSARVHTDPTPFASIVEAMTSAKIEANLIYAHTNTKEL